MQASWSESRSHPENAREHHPLLLSNLEGEAKHGPPTIVGQGEINKIRRGLMLRSTSGSPVAGSRRAP